MKPMPRSLREMQQEAVTLGLLFPGTMNKEVALAPRVRLLKYAYNSHCVGRSFNEVTVLLLGISGSGKSAVTNHVLGVDIAATSAFTSETRATTEYVLTAKSGELGVSNLRLAVVDTPGLDDTEGEEQDACNIMSIKNYCKNKPSLSGCFPNVILLVIQATNTRFSGKKSRFYKALKEIGELGVVDKMRPNVVVVVTFACSLHPHNAQDWKDAVEAKNLAIADVVRETLKVNAPIVWMENEYKDLAKSSDGHQTKLPDGTWQPKNLFVAISEVLKASKDDLGLMAFKRFFSLSLAEKKYVKVGHSVRAKLAESEQLSPQELKIYNELMRKAAEGTRLPQVVTMINDYIEQNVLSVANRNEAQQISTDLVEQAGLLTQDDLKEHSIGSLRSLMMKEPSEFGIKLLKEVLGVSSTVEAMPDAFMCVGRGYNILNDETKPFAIFKMDGSVLQDTAYGIKLPSSMTLSKVQQMETFMEHFEDEGHYVKNRLTQVGVNAEVDIKLFKMKSRSGFSKGANQGAHVSSIESSFLYEKRLFKVDITDPSALTLMDNFKNAVHSSRLPCTYNKDQRDNRANFEDFFNAWGHFVVSSAYGGGSVEVKHKAMATANLAATLQEVRAELDATFRNISCGFNFTHRDSTRMSSSANLSTSQLKYNGGNSAHQAMNVASATPDSWKRWETSLAKHPALLTTELSLTPIFDMVGLVDPNKVAGCRDALYDFLGGKFTVYLHKEEEENRRKEQKEEETNRAKIAAQTKPSDDGGGCFPGTSLVNVKDSKEPVRMSDLTVGDEVLTYNNNQFVYSPVFMFAHRDPAAPNSYLKISFGTGSISISPKHLLYVNKSDEVKFADQVVVGDSIWMAEEQDHNFQLVKRKVEKIVTVTEKGFYAPFTLSGMIVVDDVLASCYANVADFGRFSGHAMAHACIAPLRALYHVGGFAARALKIPAGKSMPPAVEWPLDIFRPFLSF